MKLFTTMTLLCATMSCAHAAPHIWQSGFRMGFSEYKIENEQKQTLRISCNTTAGENYDHSAIFINVTSEYQNTDKFAPLSFVFNDTLNVTPLGNTKWRNGAAAWNNFKNNLATATKIDVYLQSQKVATFYPSQPSIRDIAKEIQGCDALG